MAVTDGITFALAVVGATGTVAQVYTTIRDRPRLRLDARSTRSIDRPPAVYLVVSNVGTRPTTVREVGFYAHKSEVKIYDADAQGEDDWKYTGEAELHAIVARGVFLEPGQTQEFDATTRVLGMGAWADEPLRLYAKDIRGRRLWGGAARVLRILFGPDPPIDKMPDDMRRMFDPPPEKFRLPAQVEPGWKLWKRAELRNPKRWKGD